MKPGMIMLTEGEINNLVVAVNQYVSTGDHIAEGVAYQTPPGDHYVLAIPVSKSLPLDQEDFSKLRARIAEIAKSLPVNLHKDPTSDPRFDYWMLSIHEDSVDTLIDALLERPGPLGWGSPKPLVDEYLARSARQKEGE